MSDAQTEPTREALLEVARYADVFAARGFSPGPLCQRERDSFPARV
jgi:hypothetical protein